MNINSGKILKSANKYAMVFLECVFDKEGLHMEELNDLILKLNEKDSYIIRQIYAIVYRYLEKRGRL